MRQDAKLTLFKSGDPAFLSVGGERRTNVTMVAVTCILAVVVVLSLVGESRLTAEQRSMLFQSAGVYP